MSKSIRELNGNRQLDFKPGRMKNNRLIFVLFIVGSVIFVSAAEGEDEILSKSDVTKLVDELKAKAENYFRQGNFDDSLELMEKILALNIKTWGEGSLESQIARNTKKMILDEKQRLMDNPNDNANANTEPGRDEKEPIAVNQTDEANSENATTSAPLVEELNVKDEL